MSIRWGGWLPPLILAACISGGGGAELEPVDAADVLEFAERIGSFYSLLEGERVDSLITYQDAELRTYFADERQFADYYALLANTLREHQFRHARPDKVVIREFRFLDGRASVDVRIVGRHERGLIFWEQEIELTDVWVEEGGTWFVAPGKL